MSKQRGSDKITRVLRFLLGLRSGPVAEAMAAAGLKDADVAEAWALFPGLTRRHIQHLRPNPARRAYEDISAWLARWRPIVLATLGRHAPERRKLLDGALDSKDAPSYDISALITLLRFFDDLVKTDDGRAARATLASRGLTEAVVDDARRLLRAVETLEESTPNEETEASFERSERALWAWYLEWSAIARAAIRERGLRRALGFSPRGEED